jgi:transcriptional regulator
VLSPTGLQSISPHLLKAIVAFEIEVIEVTEVKNAFKLSQDRDAKSYQNIIEKLKDQDEDGKVIAAEMEKRKKDLYPDK